MSSPQSLDNLHEEERDGHEEDIHDRDGDHNGFPEDKNTRIHRPFHQHGGQRRRVIRKQGLYQTVKEQ